MHKSAILIELPGHKIDPELLATAAKLYPDGWGCSVVIDNQLSSQGAAEKVTVEGLIKMKEDFEADNFILTLFKNDGEIKEDDLQPFALGRFVDEKNQPLIVAHLAGTFQKYADQSGYSAAHNFAEQWLTPAIDVIFEDTTEVQDLDQLMDELATNSDFHAKALEEAGADAVIVLHSHSDKEVRISDPKHKDRSFEWGYLSHGEGFEEPKTVKTVKKGTAPIDAESKLIKKDSESKMVVVTIPEMSMNDRRSYIFKRLGRQPPDWKTITEIVIDRKTAEKFGDVGIKDFKDLGKAVGEYPPKEEKKETAVVKQASQPPVPLIVAEDKKKSETFLNSLDPTKWKDAETKISNWSDQMGHDLFVGPKAVVKWPYEELLRYIDTVKGGAGPLMFQLVKIAAQYHELASKKTGHEEKANGNGKKVVKKAG